MDTNIGKRQLSQAHLQQNLQCNSEPEHTFNQLYNDLQKASQTQLGWQWLLPLRSADAHHLQIPDTDQQPDFGDLVLSLTEILINSLNEKSLKKLIPFEKQEAFKNKKGIALLEAVLHVNHLEGADAHIVFLQKLQGLCSSGSEHRTGCNYLEAAKHFGFGNQSLQNVFVNILNSASDTLNYFIILVNSGRIREIIKRNEIKATYAILDEMVGSVNFGATDASVNHDDVIYELQSKK